MPVRIVQVRLTEVGIINITIDDIIPFSGGLNSRIWMKIAELQNSSLLAS